MTYSNDFLEQIRAACPMETIAGNYVNLIRRGRHYVCNCPFHSEKSPSCTIFPETQSFYCFGCGAGGDVITQHSGALSATALTLTETAGSRWRNYKQPRP